MSAYTPAQQEYLASVDGAAHQSAVEIIGRLEAERDALRKDRDECAALFEIDRNHELIGPHEECGCPSCNLHHVYRKQLVVANALGKRLAERHQALIRWCASEELVAACRALGWLKGGGG